MYHFLPFVLISFAITGCAISPSTPPQSKLAQLEKNQQNPNQVTCLLPGKVKKAGYSFSYLSPRRQIRTSEQTCRIRGGEVIR